MKEEVDKFQLARIEMTPEQRQALIELEKAFERLGEVLRSVMRKVGSAMSTLFDALTPNMNKQEFTQKHKAWKKDKFYY